jgi:hydrogenase maturation factor
MLGKIGKYTFDKIIYPNLGERRNEVIVPPMNGVDVGVVDLMDGRVLVTKTDPVFIVKEYGLRKAAWFAVHILASDLMTSGISPQYALIDLNLPPSMTDQEFEEMWKGISDSVNYPALTGRPKIILEKNISSRIISNL